MIHLFIYEKIYIKNIKSTGKLISEEVLGLKNCTRNGNVKQRNFLYKFM